MGLSRSAARDLTAGRERRRRTTTYYVYEAGGRRARKVTERQNGTRAKERVNLDGFEVYREYDGSGDR